MAQRAMPRVHEPPEPHGRPLVDEASDIAERAGAYMQARMTRVSEQAQELAGRANARVERLTGKPVESWAGEVREFMRTHPLQSLAITIAVGYVLGKLTMSRR
jgi:ElaB/YqjD/DUF883 family membrane-anchored ribosome-binding protein